MTEGATPITASGELSVANEADAVATATVHRPPNSFFDTPLIRAIADALGRTDCRAIVLRSDGKHLCAGRDFSQPRDEGDAPEELYAEAVRLLTTLLPRAAAFQGAAIGRGLGLALAAHLGVGTPRARFAASFSRLGLHHAFGLSVLSPASWAATRRRSSSTPASGSTARVRPTSGDCTGWSTRSHSTPRPRPSPPVSLPPPRWRGVLGGRPSGATCPAVHPGDRTRSGETGAAAVDHFREGPVVRARPHDSHRRGRHRGRVRRSPPGRRDGTIAGTALDAFAVEPLPADSPLRGLDNVVMTPRIGYVTDDRYRLHWPSGESIVAYLRRVPIRELG